MNQIKKNRSNNQQQLMLSTFTMALLRAPEAPLHAFRNNALSPPHFWIMKRALLDYKRRSDPRTSRAKITGRKLPIRK